MKPYRILMALGSILWTAGALADGPAFDPHIVDQLMIRITPDATIDGVVDRFNLQWPGTSVARSIASRRTYLLQLPPNTDSINVEHSVAGWINPNPNVPDPQRPLVWVEANYLGQASEGQTGTIYVRTLENGQQLYANQYALARMGVPVAQQLATGAGVMVAVLDTGIDADHPELAGRVLASGYNFVDQNADVSDYGNGVNDDPAYDSTVDECAGHGTFVAGLISLVAPDATLLPVKVLNDEGHGDAFIIAQGIYYAIDQGAEVINMSLGSTYDAICQDEAMAEAQSRGIVVIAAAGNLNRETRWFPATEDDFALGFSGVDHNDVKASFSNYNRRMFLAAPATSFFTGGDPSDPGNYDPTRSIYSIVPEDGYGVWSGTSLGTAFASGAAALVRSQHPEWAPNATTWWTLRGVLESTSVNIDAQNPAYQGGDDRLLGAGRLDVGAAVNAGPPAPTPGDLDNDGDVDFDDLVRLLSDWGLVHSSADLNADGSVNFPDLVILLSNYGM